MMDSKTSFKEILTELSLSGQGLPEKLAEKHIASGIDAETLIRDHFNCPVVDLASYSISSDVLRLIPEETSRFHNILPVELKDGRLLVATIDPTDFNLLRELRFITGLEIEFVISSRSVIQRMIEESYSKSNQGVKNIPGTGERHHKGAGQNLSASASPIIKLVNEIVTAAIRRNASDIHFEPFENELKVRYRIDGLLQETYSIPANKKAEVISRIKIMASLDIAEKRRPQDGRIRVDFENKGIDIRVSTLPTRFGEKIVLRILDKSAVALELTSLGMDNAKLKSFKQVITRPYGMVLVCGPTGSGKTTSLYAALNHIKSPTVNISTVEDPIEYHMDGVNQTQMKSEIGLTFATALRTLLRQDPNIIMVGEIRDKETADIAVRASLTGHLVLSTIHTNDAPTAVTRLLDMGIEPFLISSSLTQIVAQRLVRRICGQCSTEIELSPTERAETGLTGRASRGKGCQACSNTGYKGRIGLYEVLNVTENIKRLIIEKKSAHEIRQLAVSEGMTTLRDDGIAKVKAGITTVEEVLRETLFQT